MKNTSVYLKETERGREKLRIRKRECESEEERMKEEGFDGGGKDGVFHKTTDHAH